MKRMLSVILLILLLASPVWAAKTSAVVDAWEEVAEDAVRTGAATTISDSDVTTVTVSVASTHLNAGEGMYIIIQTSVKSSGNEDWTTIPGGKLLVLVGTANLVTITNNPANPGTTVFTVASTTGYTTDGIQYIFIEDLVDVTKSEIMQIVSFSSNTSITVLDGSTNQHTNTSVLSNLVEKHIFSIPTSAHRVRITYDNTFDADGTAPTINCHATVDEVVF